MQFRAVIEHNLAKVGIPAVAVFMDHMNGLSFIDNEYTAFFAADMG